MYDGMYEMDELAGDAFPTESIDSEAAVRQGWREGEGWYTMTAHYPQHDFNYFDL